VVACVGLALAVSEQDDSGRRGESLGQ
jgi:hypothetical protein